MYCSDLTHADCFSAWATAIQALLAGGALIFVAYQSRILVTQAKEIRVSLQSDAHDSLYSQYGALLRALIDKPHLRPYLYGRKCVSGGAPEPPDLRHEVDAVCELALALIEHAVMVQDNLKDGSWEGCWRPYAKALFSSSPELCALYDTYSPMYTPQMQGAIANIRDKTANESPAPHESDRPTE